jgi:hypothetical protein
MGNVKAQFELCRKCDMLAKLPRPGGSTQLYCMAGAFSRVITKGTMIGVLKDRGKDCNGTEREPRFSHRGDWYISEMCPWYLQQSFLMAEKNEQGVAKAASKT